MPAMPMICAVKNITETASNRKIQRIRLFFKVLLEYRTTDHGEIPTAAEQSRPEYPRNIYFESILLDITDTLMFFSAKLSPTNCI